MVKKNMNSIITLSIIVLFLFLVFVFRQIGFNEEPLPFIMGGLIIIVHLIFNNKKDATTRGILR